MIVTCSGGTYLDRDYYFDVTCHWRLRAGSGMDWKAPLPMILSGAQSALAGAFFVKKAADPSIALNVADVAPYAAFGAIYFAISAVVLLLRGR
jgi:hypothetical protein